MGFEFFYDSIDESLMRIDLDHGIPEVYWRNKREWHNYPDGLKDTQPITEAEAAKLIPSEDLTKAREDA